MDRSTRRAAAAGPLAAALLLGAVAGGGATAALTAREAAAQAQSGAPESVADLAARLEPAVVNVQVVKDAPRGALQGPGPFELPAPPEAAPFGPMTPRRMPLPPGMPMPRRQGVGSGFVLSADGYVVTNDHVVDGAREVKVTFASGDEYSAKVVGRDPKTELALLKVEPKGPLPAVTLGDSDRIRVGDPVIAIGNPFGLDGTVTAGILSAKGRNIGAGPYDDFLQTDAAINPGNSGGPLFNMKGEVVGINTAIVAGGQGVGFAIPINLAKQLIPQLKEGGRVTRGWLGVAIQPVTPALARSLGLPEPKGALVASVNPGGPAAQAGVKPGDVIVEFAGRKLDESAGLPTLVSGVKPGTDAPVAVVRDGKRETLTVKVGRMPDEDVVMSRDGAGAARGRAGLALAPVPDALARSLELEGGAGALVTAVAPDGPAARAGVRPGDVVVQVKGKAIAGPEEAASAIQGAPAGEPLLLRIARDGGYLYATLEFPKG
jgi:serine protease Do